MGSSISTSKEDVNVTEKRYKRYELRNLFQLRVSLLFSGSELAAVSQGLLGLIEEEKNINLDQFVTIMTWGINISDLNLNQEHAAALLNTLKILYNSFAVLGHLPFLKDALSLVGTPDLNSKQLLIPIALYSGKLAKVWPTCDLLTLFFASLSTSLIKVTEKDANTQENFLVRTIANEDHTRKESSDELSRLSLRIQWRSFEPLTTLDNIDIATLTVSFIDLHRILTYLLIIGSITPKRHDKMVEEFQARLSNSWKNYSVSAVSLLRFLNPEITSTKLNSAHYSLDCLRKSYSIGLPSLIVLSMSKLFKYFVFLATVSDSNEKEKYDNQRKELQAKTHNMNVFYETRLVNFSTVETLSIALSIVDSSVTITPNNLVELYNGSKSGFLIRSLETKIFKWQAATILIVSGRRLRPKTMETNRRYHEFDSQYPRFFRSTENRIRPWQSDADVVTYAVYLKHPWVNSNKNNFGDENTAIISILPIFDIFASRRDLVLAGKLIYFNNMGMGLGFGNSQPINKNNTRKFLPGTVSLTIEANLEFAVFRHVPNAGSNQPEFFNTSRNTQLSSEDYEDRFMITDLEVWGIGSTKELEAQRKEWEWEEKQALARQSVNLRDLGEERAFLEMAGLVGNHAGGGSI